MENFNQDCDYDYRRYDRIWQRVAPHLDPYPEIRSEQGMAARGEGSLPGAQMDPCCMGSVARESLLVLGGFIEEELADCRMFAALARQAPNAASARLLREIAREESAHAKRLMTVHYLITGECYQPSLACQPVNLPPWCQALRERYHAEACNGFNYIRAAEGTTDPCLTQLLSELSEDEYRHARQLLELLEQFMGKMTSCASGRGRV